MIYLTSTDKLMLRDLYKAESGMLAFTFYVRYKISPAMVFNSANKLKSHGFIVYDDDFRIELTQIGKEMVVKLGRKEMLTKMKTWRNCPEQYKQNQSPVNKPYVPRRYALDIELKQGGD